MFWALIAITLVEIQKGLMLCPKVIVCQKVIGDVSVWFLNV